MEDAAFQIWWSLHVRAARGEELSGKERRAYETGLAELHASETLVADAEAAREARAHLSGLEREHARLAARREALEDEIGTLNAALSAR